MPAECGSSQRTVSYRNFNTQVNLSLVSLRFKPLRPFFFSQVGNALGKTVPVAADTAPRRRVQVLPQPRHIDAGPGQRVRRDRTHDHQPPGGE